MQLIQQFPRSFEGTPLRTFLFRGQPLWLAREVGLALGYADRGGRLVSTITEDWAEELEEGRHFLVLAGEDLKAFRVVAELPTDSVGSSLSGHARHLMLLTEVGVDAVLLLTRKPAGKRLRNFLASEVMPSIRATGQYQVPSPLPPRVLLPLEEATLTLQVITQARTIFEATGGLDARSSFLLRDRTTSALARLKGGKDGLVTFTVNPLSLGAALRLAREQWAYAPGITGLWVEGPTGPVWSLGEGCPGTKRQGRRPQRWPPLPTTWPHLAFPVPPEAP